MNSDHAVQQRQARSPADEDEQRRCYLIGLARGFAGAVIFMIPMIMTMEMWQLGFSMDRLRLALLLCLMTALLVPLSAFSGFERTVELKQDLIDALSAAAIGFIAAAVLLSLLGIIVRGMPVSEILGMISVQAIPGAMGAVLARSVLGQGDRPERSEEELGYGGELILAVAGALFLALNMAPTEEMILIAFKMSAWHALATAALSLGILHAFIFALDFRGGSAVAPESSLIGLFFRWSVVSYALALLTSLYVLWTFGRLDGLSLSEAVRAMVVLGFPAAVGAAAARLIL